jgi:Recombination endonuclease VII
MPYKNVDHCHTTGKIRGLLCGNCNSALGLIKENIPSMENMIAYIKKTSIYFGVEN